MSKLDSNIAKNKRTPVFSRSNLFYQPKGMPYLSWKKRLHRCLRASRSNQCQRNLIARKRKKTRALKVLRDTMKKLEAEREKIVTEQITEVLHRLEAAAAENEAAEPEKVEELRLELITILKQFCERKNLHEQIEVAIPDRRNQDLITYSKQSIIMSALIIFLFRMTSGNRFDDKTHDDDNKYSKTNVARFIDSPEDRVPVIKTIEKFLCNLEADHINHLMILFFKDLMKSKFFAQHSNIMPGDFFLVAADCVHTHTYYEPHHVDINGKNNCGCCLKRVSNRDTPNEKVRWQHHMLVYSFVFLGGLKIPIYRHNIRAKQVVGFENASEESHKQECELVALKVSLPIFREAFPRMKIIFLLDGLYANRPLIQFLGEQRCGYLIVRKEGCLSTVGEDCDGQTKLPNHAKNCTKTYRGEDNGWKIERRYEWFNSINLSTSTKKDVIKNTRKSTADLTTNVLRLSENRTKDGVTKSYKCEWLVSWMLSLKNCQTTACYARLRWEEEDMFQTLKRRGYNLCHDYSRNPRSCFNWQAMALFAFGIFELFRFSEAVKQRGDWPQITLAETLLSQLLYGATIELFSERHLKARIQFRYNFKVEPIMLMDSSQNSPKTILETG